VKVEVDILVHVLVGVMRARVNGMDVLETFFSRRIQPLQERVKPMWTYEGLSDKTRVHPQALTGTELEGLVKLITSARDNPQGGRMVDPYEQGRLPAEVNLCLLIHTSGQKARRHAVPEFKPVI
jgi:hypothetical protein